MRTNKHGLALIKRFEGYIREIEDGKCVPYLDRLASKKYWTPGMNGLLTQGYGSTGPRVQNPNQVWTRAQAEAELKRELRQHEIHVEGLLEVPVSDNQFSALVSLCYNIGGGNFQRSSLLRKLNNGDYKQAQRSFKLYNKAGGKVYRGLVRRRQAEANLFALPADKTIIENSVKLTWIQRVRMTLLGLLPVGALSWENLTYVRDFVQTQGGWLMLGMGAAAWLFLKWLEMRTIDDVADRRYIPSKLKPHFEPVNYSEDFNVDVSDDQIMSPYGDDWDFHVSEEDYINARMGD